MIWAEFGRAAPVLASAARESLSATRIALLGTIRSDGAPRISPVEPYFAGNNLLIGAMAWSRKAADLERDARLVLHSTITSPDSAEPEIKLYGHAVTADPTTRAACPDAWWTRMAENSAVVFAMDIVEASLVVWDLAAGEFTVTSWSPAAGLHVVRKAYP
jgi:Pyridoxamine 5'-phosphate oxidase